MGIWKERTSMTSNLISVLIHCLILLTSSQSFCQDISSVELLNRAERLRDAGRYLEAVGIYQDLLEIATKPELVAESLRKSADIFSHFLNQPERALKHYDQLITQFPVPVAFCLLTNAL